MLNPQAPSVVTGLPQTPAEVQELLYRYVSVWNERDAALRRSRIEKLWVPDGAHYWRMGVCQGYDALQARVVLSFDKWIAAGKYAFQPTANVAVQHNGVKFSWQMVSTGNGTVEGRGCEVLLLAPDGRIQSDYQFPEQA